MRRIILLGASNLTIALPRLLHAVQNAFDGPLEVFAALGHGRSFGMWSRILHRTLPGIVDCGLWDALKSSAEPAVPTRGLITDVGNDLLYGASVPQIAEWLETCLTRLKESGAEVTMTLLPLESARRLPAWRYYATRALFFPGSRISYAQIRQRAEELHQRQEELARQQGARTVELPGKWYGLDPIHIRHTRRRQAWKSILCGWPDFPPETPTGQAPLSLRLRVMRTEPQLRRVFGRERRAGQPVLQDGRLRVSLF